MSQSARIQLFAGASTSSPKLEKNPFLQVSAPHEQIDAALLPQP